MFESVNEFVPVSELVLPVIRGATATLYSHLVTCGVVVQPVKMPTANMSTMVFFIV